MWNNMYGIAQSAKGLRTLEIGLLVFSNHFLLQRGHSSI